MHTYGYYKVSAVTMPVAIADPHQNSSTIKRILKNLDADVQVVVFPELCLSGYTCADLFHQRILLDSCMEELVLLAEDVQEDLLAFIGLPVYKDNQLFNCAAILHNGRILGFVPKSYLPNHYEFYERRWFSSADARLNDNYVLPDGTNIPFMENLLLHDERNGAVIAAEICEDLWVSLPPSTLHTHQGANLIVNLSASNETIGKSEYRRNLVKMQSAKCICGYVYACAGKEESTTDVVFSGHNLIAECGTILKETSFAYNEEICSVEIDIERIMHERMHSSYKNLMPKDTYSHVYFKGKQRIILPSYPINAYPFVPANPKKRKSRCQEILQIQATGLAQRLTKIHCSSVVIGISGGLDSTLALIVTLQAYAMLHLDPQNIHAITMPGFGTTSRTWSNSRELMDVLHVDSKEILIHDACLQHFKDIGHDPDIKDITYENTQARERTQILMDIANASNAIVVGTGDLSELALGWCTYNGDHMSMYAVNATIPKTLVRDMVETYADALTETERVYLPYLSSEECRKVAGILHDICATPVSPELLPPKENGEIQQLTEASIGAYDHHDFFLYYMLRHGFSPKKIFMLAQQAFPEVDDTILLTTMKTFYQRFFTQQFKRSCMPDGVKVGSICLSPRGDWRMPSDASYALWMRELEDISFS